MRSLFVYLHRWAGLLIAGFLFITGLTGAVISWDHELDEWLNPHLTEAHTLGDPLPVFDLVKQTNERYPTMQVLYFPLKTEPGHALALYAEPRVNPETKQLYPELFNQVFIDPVSGEELGTRTWGAVWPITKETVVSFLYKLHYSLHIPAFWGSDRWGVWLLGVIALIWTLDCFSGLILTLPSKKRTVKTSSVNKKTWLKRWQPAWRIRWNKGRYKLNFDLHQAVSLWTWALLFIVAFTAFSLNLYKEVFFPVMSAISDVTPSPYDKRKMLSLDKINETPSVDFLDAIQRASVVGKELGWEEPVGSIYYANYYGFYQVNFFHPENEHGAGGVGHRETYIDANNGEQLGLRDPWQGSAADIFNQAQFPLHSGRILGLPGRILISIMGLVVAMLSVTGVIVWWRKRKARLTQAKKRQRQIPTQAIPGYLTTPDRTPRPTLK